MITASTPKLNTSCNLTNLTSTKTKSDISLNELTPKNILIQSAPIPTILEPEKKSQPPLEEIDFDKTVIGWYVSRAKCYEYYFKNNNPIAFFQYQESGICISETYYDNQGHIRRMAFYDEKGILRNQTNIALHDKTALRQCIYNSEQKIIYNGYLNNTAATYQGKGITYDENGIKLYDGDWVNGEKTGIGIIYDECEIKEYMGELLTGEKHGNGIYWYKNGQKQYEGGFEHNNWHGQGTLYLDNGIKIYEGGWNHGEKHGKGVEYDDEQRKIYDGSFNNGNREGKGSLYAENGLLIYSGYWKMDKREGKGNYYDENGVIWYSGYWRDDKKKGKGICYDPKGRPIFKGTLNDNTYNGYGKRLDYQGNIYVKGDWADDKLIFYELNDWEIENSYDVIDFEDDYLYVGKIDQGQPHGYGTLWKKHKAIKIYEGNWKHGEKHGFGKSFYAKVNPRQQYCGIWSNNLKNGPGISYFENGKKNYKGYWTQGESIGKFGINFRYNGKIEEIRIGIVE